MDENENNMPTAGAEAVAGQEAVGEPAVSAETEPKTQGNEPSGTAPEGAEKQLQPQPSTFTQEQLNQIIQDRLGRASQAFFDRYGVKDQAELDALVGEAQVYETTMQENAQLKEKLAFLLNNIDPSREDDVKTYFKGKGIAMSDEALKQVLQTHPEWVKASAPEAKPTTSITPIGAEKQEAPKENEEDKMAKMFGLDHFVPPLGR